MNNNNIVGGIRENMVITFSRYTMDMNFINNIIEMGNLERYLIGEGIIPYNFNYNENVYIRNSMIIDFNQNRFIYENRYLGDILMDAIQNNLDGNNQFNIIVFRSIRINNNLNNLNLLVSDMLNN